MSAAAPTGTRRRRPFGVVLIALFLVLDAALAIAQRIFDLGSGTRQDIFAEADGRISLIIVGLVVLRLIAAVGLWAGWRRAWVLTMLLVGISLTLNLWLYWTGQHLYLRMAIDVVLAMYLNQGAVREYFDGKPSSSNEASSSNAKPSGP